MNDKGNIAASMHGILSSTSVCRSAVRLSAVRLSASLLTAALLGSCASVRTDKQTYRIVPAERQLNGASVRLQVDPVGERPGGYSANAMVVFAAKVNLDGPFHWRFVATGRSGEHREFIVHRVQTHTATTHRNESYPAAKLGQIIPFTDHSSRPGTAIARYRMPGQLNVKPTEDGALDVRVFATVKTNAKRESSWLDFHLVPDHSNTKENLFVPTEIINSWNADTGDWDGNW